MTEQEQEEQFAEIRPLVETMFEISSSFVSMQGNFLPHGGFLDLGGKVNLCAAGPENDETDALEVLPLLHEGLRQQTSQWETSAIAVSESVFIGERMNPAIKVLIEHRNGLTLAFYQTWRKRFLRSPKMGEIKIHPADPEVGNWDKPTVFPQAAL